MNKRTFKDAIKSKGYVRRFPSRGFSHDIYRYYEEAPKSGDIAGVQVSHKIVESGIRQGWLVKRSGSPDVYVFPESSSE